MNALEYDEGRNYSVSIIKTIQRVVGATADGKWGPQTVNDVEIWQGHHGLKPDGKVGTTTLHAILAVADHPQGGGDGERGQDHDDGGHQHHDPPQVSDTIRHVGVWSTSSSFGRNAAGDVEFCRAHGINRLDVFVNHVPQDQSFHMHDEGEIVDLCARAKDAGMEVHLTSWIMPFAGFIDAAAAQLIPLSERVGAKSLIWDAEEPWNRHDGVNYEEAAERVASAFASLVCPMNVSGIINTRRDRFGPLARVCNTMVPQCYATSRNNLDPRTIASTTIERWRGEFAQDKPFIIGLAAYRQTQVGGLGTAAAMTASLENVKSLGIDSVVYWSLPAVKQSPVIARLIAQVLAPAGS